MSNLPMKVTEMRAQALATVIPEFTDVFPHATAIGSQEFVVPVSVGDRTLYVGFSIAVKDFVGTKARAPFSLGDAVAKFAAEQDEAKANALAKAEEKAAKEKAKAEAKAAKAK